LPIPGKYGIDKNELENIDFVNTKADCIEGERKKIQPIQVRKNVNPIFMVSFIEGHKPTDST
jgi:hypothetical protein